MSGFIKKKITNIQTLGERLQHHRQDKGLSQEKAARAINLNARYIYLLENNAYDKLPASVYTMNILKKYAELLDLNPTTAADIFQKEKALFLKIQKQQARRRAGKFHRLLNHFLNPRSIKYLIIVILLTGISIYIGLSVDKIIAPPQLIISSPADNLLTQDHQVKIEGITEKEVDLKINNRPLLSDKQGNFSIVLDLQKGLNIIKISARKKHGKEQVVYRTVIVADKPEDDLK